VRSGVTRPALALAGVGAILVMIGIDALASIAGLVAIVLGVILAAPAARGPKGGWWTLMASGAVLSIVGALVAIPTETVGGLLALVGGAAVLVAVALAY